MNKQFDSVSLYLMMSMLRSETATESGGGVLFVNALPNETEGSDGVLYVLPNNTIYRFSEDTNTYTVVIGEMVTSIGETSGGEIPSALAVSNYIDTTLSTGISEVQSVLQETT